MPMTLGRPYSVVSDLLSVDSPFPPKSHVGQRCPTAYPDPECRSRSLRTQPLTAAGGDTPSPPLQPGETLLSKFPQLVTRTLREGC